MPINPLELQINFSQIGQVAKTQSVIKDAEQLKENQINSLIEKEGEFESEDIPVTKDVSEGVGKIKDYEQKKNKKDNNAKKEKKNEDLKEETEENEDEKLKIPRIGKNVDIIG